MPKHPGPSMYAVWSLEVARDVVVVVRLRTNQTELTVILREVIEPVRWSFLQNVSGYRDNIATLVFVVAQHGPRHGKKFLSHSKNSAKAQRGKHDVVRLFVENHVLDVADFVACRIVDVGSLDLRSQDRTCMTRCRRHFFPSLLGLRNEYEVLLDSFRDGLGNK